jgi:hypothetical protein
VVRGRGGNPERLTRHDPALLGQEWAKLRIDSARIPGRLYRDPCSQLGALLEVEHVPAEAIEIVRRWVPPVRPRYLFATRLHPEEVLAERETCNRD